MVIYERKINRKKKPRGGEKEKISLLNPFMVGAKFTQAFAGKIQEILILCLAVFNCGGKKKGSCIFCICIVFTELKTLK